MAFNRKYFYSMQMLLALVAVVFSPWEASASSGPYPPRYTCPLCSTEFPSRAMGYTGRLDHRLTTMSIGWLYPEEIPVCPKDGFVLYEKSFTESELEELGKIIQTPEYTAETVSYGKLAVIYKAKGKNPYNLAKLYVMASWQVEEHSESRRRYLENALFYIEKHLKSHANTHPELFTYSASVLAGEVERRLGRFEAAKARLEAILASGKITGKFKDEIIPKELELIKNKKTELLRLEGTW